MRIPGIGVAFKDIKNASLKRYVRLSSRNFKEIWINLTRTSRMRKFSIFTQRHEGTKIYRNVSFLTFLCLCVITSLMGKNCRKEI